MIHSFSTHLPRTRTSRLLALAAWAFLVLAAPALRAQDEAPEAVFPEMAPGVESVDAKPLPPGALSRTTYELLGEALRAILVESGEGMRIGMYIEDADFRIPVVDVNGTDQFTPGSAMLLPTAAVALDSLGSKYRFHTTLGYSGEVVGHVLRGNLIVTGTGDPTIGTVLEKGDKAPTDLFRRWAAEVRRYNIETVMGALIADDSYFDDRWEGPDWPLEDRGAESLAQVSALPFHGNCVDLTWKTGWRRGQPPECILSPVRHYASVHTEVMSAAKSSGLHIRLEREGTNNVIIASGIMPVRSTSRMRASINNPSLYFATALRETLQACGVSIYRARPVLIGEIEDKAGATSDTSPVVVHTSAFLAEIVPAAVRNRDLMAADDLLKAIGKEVGGTGSFASGSGYSTGRGVRRAMPFRPTDWRRWCR
jgi:D-alanyl-D-alanine carboxypeptidase/D-alanyl-D-alanine-endopeptidase (penicillin-binding protein 4)